MSLFHYLQFGLYIVLSFKFAFSTDSQCELQCSSWDFVCAKPVTYSTKVPYAVCNPTDDVRYPESTADVEKIVKEANVRGVTVKLFSNMRSQTDLICTAGIPLAIGKLNLKFAKMNPDNTATFGAAVILFDCFEFLRNNGRALDILPVYGNGTVGGSVLKGEHGSSLKRDSTFASLVVKMTIINSKGEIQIISSPDDLKAFTLSLGLLGICIDITLRTVKLYKIKVHNYLESDKILSNGDAIKWAKENDDLSLYWFPSSEQVVVSKKTIVSAETQGNAYSNDYLSSTYATFARIFYKAKETSFNLTSTSCVKTNTVGYEILHAIENFIKLSLVQSAPEIPPIYTIDGTNIQNPAVGYPHRISSPICYSNPQGPHQVACPDSHGVNSITTLDYEFSIKASRLADFVKAVKNIIQQAPSAFPWCGIRVTFSGSSDIFLSPSYGQESAYIEFRMVNRKDLFNEPSGSLAAYQAIIQTLIHDFNGRSSWSKGGLAVHSAENIKLKLDKRARDGFIDALKKHDPKGVFMNKFGLRLTGKSSTSDVNPLVTRCALLGSCFCSKDGDCGPTQVCTTLLGKYRVCQTKKDVKDVLPPLSHLVKYLDVDVAKLASDALSKC